ncbi:ice-binding family protein [Arsukibacterium sp.]|uniref:ice-binding family protein n=1 Tax=Arsukibacterium sp. TaxID=1977258 RepID=UPI0034319F01
MGNQDPILGPDPIEGLISIEVASVNPTIAEGENQQFTATGTYANGTALDISNRVSWTSSAPDIATITNSPGDSDNAAHGLATGISAGSSQISATLGGKSAETTLTVTAALTGILVTPANGGVIVGQNLQFTATGVYSDGSSANLTSQVDWVSSDNTVALPNASMTSSSGLISGVAAGTVQISASIADITAEATLTVRATNLLSISVTPLTSSVAVDVSRQFTATGIYADGSTVNITASVLWASADNDIATLNSSGSSISGLATGQAAGVVQISATVANGSGANTSGNDIIGAATLSVTAANLASISVTPENPTVLAGLSRQFNAIGTFSDGSTADLTSTANWTSDTVEVATMNASQTATSGLATAISTGMALIQASYAGIDGSTTLTVNSATLTAITVSPASATVLANDTAQFTATGTYSDGSSANITTAVSWTSADTTVAVMNASGQANSGLATAMSPGMADIVATLNTIQGSAELTVNAALADNPQAPVMGELQRFIIIASQAITTTAGSAISDGDMAILDLARTAYAGFTPGPVAGEFAELTNGISFAPDDTTPPYVVPAPYASMVAFINQVRTDLGVAATFLAADPNPAAATQVLPSELGGLVMTRGVYRNAGNVIIQQGDLTLDAQGDPDSVFIFVIGGTFTTGAPGGNLILTGGAQASNVYWRTGGATVFGSNTSFAGNVFAWPQINLGTGAEITGRLFSVTEQVTLDANMVTKPE